MLVGTIKRITKHFGFDIVRYNYRTLSYQARAALLDGRIDTVVDVGANCGQYGLEIRQILPKVKIVSFEPLPDAFEVLQALCLNLKNWEAYNVGVGLESATMPIAVSANSQSSSFLTMQDLHLQASPESSTINKLSVAVEPLDKYLGDFGENLFIKVDTQGFEAKVLAGAPRSLSRALFVQLEVSFAQLYDGAPAPHEIIKTMYDAGFEIHTISPVFSDRIRCRLLQADILFSRPS